MVFHFVQGGGVIVLLDEGLNEIEDLLLSLSEHGGSVSIYFR